MPTVLTHPAVPIAIAVAAGKARVPRPLLAAGVAAAVIPDLDAIGTWSGVPVGAFLGHRGFTHSLLFAVLLAATGALVARRFGTPPAATFAFLFVAAASHGLLDTLTDGGPGVALLSPFSLERFFAPWRPIPVSPIGVHGLAGPRGLRVFGGELVGIWIPVLAVALGLRARRAVRAVGAVRATRRRGAAEDGR